MAIPSQRSRQLWHNCAYLLGAVALIGLVFLGLSMADFQRSAPTKAIRNLFAGWGIFANSTDRTPQSKAKRDRKPNQPKRSPFVAYEKFPETRLLSGGRVTEDGAKRLGLTDGERTLVEEAARKNLEHMRMLVVDNVQVTNKDKYSTSFYIPSLKDRGLREVESLQNDLAAILGEDRARQAMISLPVQEYYGGFGQYEVTIKVVSRQSVAIENRFMHKDDMAEIIYCDPVSGKRIFRSSSNWKNVDEKFPGLFEMAAE